MSSISFSNIYIYIQLSNQWLSDQLSSTININHWWTWATDHGHCISTWLMVRKSTGFNHGISETESEWGKSHIIPYHQLHVNKNPTLFTYSTEFPWTVHSILNQINPWPTPYWPPFCITILTSSKNHNKTHFLGDMFKNCQEPFTAGFLEKAPARKNIDSFSASTHFLPQVFG